MSLEKARWDSNQRKNLSQQLNLTALLSRVAYNNQGEFEPPSDNHLDLWVGFLLDARTPARPSKSATGRERKGNNNRYQETRGWLGSHRKYGRTWAG